jgi:hypothetical protein
MGMKWVGPFSIGELLRNCLDYDNQPWPPDKKGVYVISEKSWEFKPNKACAPLYVGGNTGKSARFRMRIGDLISDLYGFYRDDDIGHHSGGISLHEYCMKRGLHPDRLYIGWANEFKCYRCAEIQVYRELKPKLNKSVPAACKFHAG